MDGSEELHSKLERAENKLAAAQKVVASREASVVEDKSLRKAGEERKAANTETHYLRDEREAVEAKYKKVEQENKRLKKKMEEVQVGFAAQNEELKGEYQRWVNDMFFFGYQCCMKKNGITQDIPIYPSDGEDIATNSPVWGNRDLAAVDPCDRQS